MGFRILWFPLSKKYLDIDAGEYAMGKKTVLYMHAGSYNHGCEAIVRSTISIFDQDDILLMSDNKNEDIEYRVDKLCSIDQAAYMGSKISIPYVFSRVMAKFFGVLKFYRNLCYRNFLNSVSKKSLYFSIGGDNYCYDTKIKRCMFLNDEINRRGGKTVLWGVSIEPDIIKNKKVNRDLKKYSLIVARESITMDAIVESGLTNVVYCPDPAFRLQKAADVERKFDGDIVGINISPMALDYSANSEMLREAYIKMINHILETTACSIYLVPHVIWNGGDDRVALQALYDSIEQKERLFMVQDADCETLKGYISHCRFFVGARTHSTIAAYSQEIPTLVVGYSVKARGIAKDLFGDWQGYVKPVQNIASENDLVESLDFIMQHEEEIRNTLHEKLMTYPKYYEDVKEKIMNLND